MQKLLDYFVPEKYELNLKINREKETLKGRVKIEGIAKSEEIKLHAENLVIEELRINGEKSSYKQEKGILKCSCRSDLQKVCSETVSRNRHDDFEESEPRDDGSERTGSRSILLEVTYSTVLNKNMEGAYLSTYKHKGKKEKVVVTQFESHYARQAFPCIDEPAAKAKFTLKIELEDYSPGDIILSNTSVKNQEKNRVEFEETPRMSTYLLAFVAGKFHGKTVRNNHGVEITTYAPINQNADSVDFANEVAAKSLDYYDEQFSTPYPLKKCDQVAIPDFEAGAMENWGLVTYRETMLLADKTATVATKKSIALTVSHELSHQWFGNLVTMEWWDDLWLNESFASIMEYMAIENLYPDFNIWESFFTRDCLLALKRDAYKDVQSVHQKVENVEDIANLFDGAIVYSKGARLMLMLIRTMGWGNFKKGLRSYFEKYKYKNTIGNNLWDELTKYADFDVEEFMNLWIENSGYPVVNGDNQERFLLDDNKKQKSSYPIKRLLDDMSGHYIIELTEDGFNKKLKNFNNLSLEQKLRLLIDYSFLAKANRISSAKLLDLVQKFKFEKSAAVWSIVSMLIGNIKLFLDPDSKEEKEYKKFIGELIKEQRENLGLKTRKEDTENEIRLRSIILALDYYAETPETMKTLAKEYQEDLTKIDPERRSDILDAKLYEDPEKLEEYIEKYQKENDPEIQDDIFAAMTLTKDEKNLSRLIKLLEEPEIVKPQDHLYLYIYLFRNPKASQKTLKWLTENWEYVKKLTGDKTIADYPRYTANAIRTKAEKTAFWDFFGSKKSDPALVRTLKIAETEIEANLNLIEANKKAVQDRLKELI